MVEKRKELKEKYKYYETAVEFLESLAEEGACNISGVKNFIKEAKEFNTNIKGTSKLSIESAERNLINVINFLTDNLYSIKQLVYKCMYEQIMEEIEDEVDSKALLKKCIDYIKKELRIVERVITIDELIAIINQCDEIVERILEYLEELIENSEDEDEEDEAPIKKAEENYYSGGSSGLGFIKWILILLLIGGILGGIAYGIFAWVVPNWSGWFSCASCADDDNDPKDYYGTYYVKNDGQTLTYEISADGCVFTNDFGTREEVSNWTYKYMSVKELYEKHSVAEKTEYIDGYALVFYNEPYLGFIPDESFVNEIFYITSTNPYKFVSGNHNYTLTKLK